MNQSTGDDFYERQDWVQFRQLATVAQRAGTSIAHLAETLVKEVVDNALDKTGDARVGLLPPNGFFVEDDGPGFPCSVASLATIFSISRPLVSSKIPRLPTRGALGNGLRVVAAAVLATGGHLVVRTAGQVVHLTPQDDGTTTALLLGPTMEPGTRIEVYLGGDLPVAAHDLVGAQRAIQLAHHGTTYSTTYKGKASPHWYSLHAFYELLQAAGDRTVRAEVAKLEGCSGTKAGKLTADLHDRPAASVSRDEAIALLMRCQAAARPVKPLRLGAVGPQAYPERAYAIERATISAEPFVDVPAVVEVWMDAADDMTGIDDARVGVELDFFVNRSPIVGDKMSALYEKRDRALLLFGGELAHAFPVGRAVPESVAVNVQCPFIARTSDGKDPDLQPFLDALRTAIARAARTARAAQVARREATLTTAEDAADDTRRAALQAAAERYLGHGLQDRSLALWEAILDLLDSHPRLRVRSVAYLLESMKVIAKTPADFDRVARALVDLRRARVVPYERIVEGHRERVKSRTFDSLADFLGMIKNAYRRDPWATQPYHVEVWVEKDGLADIVEPVCGRYRVPYVATKGQPSLTLLHDSAQAMIAANKPTILLYFGDFDPTGLNISRIIEQELCGFAVDITFRRVAVTWEQIAAYQLPTRPGKVSDNKHAAFVEKYGNECVEVDALDVISPDLLPSLVETAIRETIDKAAWDQHLQREHADREALAALVDS